MNCGYADISNYFYIQLFHIFAVAGPIHVAKSTIKLVKESRSKAFGAEIFKS